MATTANAAERRDALVERLFMDAISAFDLLSVYLGDILGLYRTLADKGPLTSTELAEAAGIHERYGREWLEQQAASSLLELQPSGDTRRYRLPEGHDEALLDSSSLSYIAPLARSLVGAVKPLDALLAAFRSGAGLALARRISGRRRRPPSSWPSSPGAFPSASSVGPSSLAVLVSAGPSRGSSLRLDQSIQADRLFFL